MNMFPTYEVKPTFYMKKIKDSDGNIIGEQAVIQFDIPSFTTYTVNTDNAKDPDGTLQKLILAAKNGDTVKVQGASDVRTYNNGGKAYLFSAVDVDYNPKSQTQAVKS